MQRILSLQILRFFAASAVIAWHACYLFYPRGPRGLVGDFGPFGVDLFFVLSGVIIAWVAPGRSAGGFLWQRLTRILPIYWLLTLVWIAALVWAHRFDVLALGTSFLLYPSSHEPYLKVAWTLRFELLFYVAAAVTLLRPRIALPILGVLYAAAFVARFVYGGVLLNFVGAPLILEFVAGVAIATIFRSRSPLLFGIALVGAVAGLIVIGFADFTGEDMVVRPLYYGLPAAFIVYLATQIACHGRIAERLAYLGDASYSAYLVHVIPLVILTPIASRIPLVIAAPLAIALCWWIAVLVHEAVEKPLLAFCRRPLVSRAPALQATVPADAD